MTWRRPGAGRGAERAEQKTPCQAPQLRAHRGLRTGAARLVPDHAALAGRADGTGGRGGALDSRGAEPTARPCDHRGRLMELATWGCAAPSPMTARWPSPRRRATAREGAVPDRANAPPDDGPRSISVNPAPGPAHQNSAPSAARWTRERPPRTTRSPGLGCRERIAAHPRR
jgi:hypothetical protein